MALHLRPALPPSLNCRRRRCPPIALFSSAAETTASAQRNGPQASTSSAQRRLETRASLVLALASQSFSVSQKVLMEAVSHISKYVFPKPFEPRNLEEALMSVPDLETVKYKVLKRTDQYEIREVEPYFVAETKMHGNSGFDLYGSSRSFNVLAAYLFGENTKSEEMKMTTPVYTRKAESPRERMDMTTPVITKRSGDEETWKMSFVMPSNYGPNLPLPKDPSVKIQQIPRKIVAVTAFAGYVTDEEIGRRESKLREALRSDREFQLKPDALAEIAQFNPPFTLPFMRRNEISLEVVTKIA